MIESSKLDKINKYLYYLDYFEKMLESVPPELIKEGKELNAKQVKKYINQLGELKEELTTSILEAMLNSELGSRYGINLPFYYSIENEDDFHLSFEVLLYVQTTFDIERNVIAVNQIAMFMVRYYGEFIIKYGNEKERAFFANNIKLLKINKIIHD